MTKEVPCCCGSCKHWQPDAVAGLNLDQWKKLQQANPNAYAFGKCKATNVDGTPSTGYQASTLDNSPCIAQDTNGDYLYSAYSPFGELSKSQ